MLLPLRRDSLGDVSPRLKKPNKSPSPRRHHAVRQTFPPVLRWGFSLRVGFSRKDAHGIKPCCSQPRKETCPMSNESQMKDRKKEVFCRYIRKAGKIIYPKNGKLFHFFVMA